MGLKLLDFKDCGLCEHYKNSVCTLGIEGEYNNCVRFKQRTAMNKWELNLESALRFMLAGNSEFVAMSGRTGRTFQYRLVRKTNQNNVMYWVYSEGLYLGVVYFDIDSNVYKFSQSLKGKLCKDDIRIASLLFILNKLYNHNYNINVKIYHLGNCGKCGVRLHMDKALRTGLCNLCRVDVIKGFG